MWCPRNINKNQKQCSIWNLGIGENQDYHRNLEFYCLNGFDDLNLDNYSAVLIKDEYNMNITNMMHCGTNYNLSCNLNDSLLCNCIGQDFVTPLSDTELIAVIIGAIVIGIIIIIVLVYYFVLGPKVEKKHEPKYSSVTNEQEMNTPD